MWYPVSTTGLQQGSSKCWPPSVQILVQVAACEGWLVGLLVLTWRPEKTSSTSSSNTDPASTFCLHLSFGRTVSSVMISMLWSNKMGSFPLSCFFLWGFNCFCSKYIIFKNICAFEMTSCWLLNFDSFFFCFSDLERSASSSKRGKGLVFFTGVGLID